MKRYANHNSNKTLIRFYDFKNLFSLIFILGQNGIFVITLLDQIAQLNVFIERFNIKIKKF